MKKSDEIEKTHGKICFKKIEFLYDLNEDKSELINDNMLGNVFKEVTGFQANC